MADIPVPKIPEICLTKTFNALDIKWIKSVNDDVTNSAYLPPDKRVIVNSKGIFFCLEINPRYSASLKQVPLGDIILLYQRLDKQKTKCFTHLVTPIGNNVIPSPYQNSVWQGRWVKVVAMTENQAIKSIPLASTDWHKMHFTGAHYNLSYGDGRIRAIDHNQQIPPSKLISLQNNIWIKFQPWIK